MPLSHPQDTEFVHPGHAESPAAIVISPTASDHGRARASCCGAAADAVDPARLSPRRRRLTYCIGGPPTECALRGVKAASGARLILRSRSAGRRRSPSRPRSGIHAPGIPDIAQRSPREDVPIGMGGLLARKAQSRAWLSSRPSTGGMRGIPWPGRTQCTMMCEHPAKVGVSRHCGDGGIEPDSLRRRGTGARCHFSSARKFEIYSCNFQ